MNFNDFMVNGFIISMCFSCIYYLGKELFYCISGDNYKVKIV